MNDNELEAALERLKKIFRENLPPSATQVMSAVALALDQPRNRMGKLDPRDYASGELLRILAVHYKIAATDRIDQAVKVMKAWLDQRLEELQEGRKC